MPWRLFFLGIVMTISTVANEASNANEPQRRKFAIAIHGGAGAEPARLSDDDKRRYQESLSVVLQTGESMLDEGATALETVEKVIRLLEDNPLFNAGRGSVFNHVGKHELDASIMDGKTRQAGAVAAVKTVKNPISLARLVMTETRHVLLIGDGAEHFADEMKHKPEVERVANDYFSTELRRKQWQEAVRRKQEMRAEDHYRGTVGCVALDQHGNLAAGTSTGGITNKQWGRVGDSPIIGAGTYADNATCAVSCTGTGEYFIRNSAAFHIAALMAYKEMTLDAAARHMIDKILEPDTGGLIALDAQGKVSMPFNTAGMFRAAVDAQGKRTIKVGR